LLTDVALTRCFAHPDRPAVAVCMSCQRPVCASCSTLWEGIHCCVDCLAARRAAAGRRGVRLRTAGVILAALALLAVLTFLRAHAGVFLAELF
jgi:B-box zinc finger